MRSEKLSRKLALFDNHPDRMRWDCDKNGCFNIKCRPKLEVFSDCFPGKINFGDVDGIIEINGKALMLEWKTRRGPLPTGQAIMYRRITETGLISVLCVVGDAETMECKGYSIYKGGKFFEFKPGDLGQVKKVIRKWVLSARKKNDPLRT